MISGWSMMSDVGDVDVGDEDDDDDDDEGDGEEATDDDDDDDDVSTLMSDAGIVVFCLITES